MSAVSSTTWSQANQRYLMAALDVVRAGLESHAAQRQEAEYDGRAKAAQGALEAAAAAMPRPAALEILADRFHLSPFEQQVLVLCAGVELDAGFAALYADAHGDPGRAYPTFSLALAALPNPHWDAISPASVLRHWRLIEVGPGQGLTASPLRMAERVLHYLAGVDHLDEGVAGLVEPAPLPDELVPSHQALAEQAAAVWAQAESALPVVQLCGQEPADRQAIATAACALLGQDLKVMLAQSLPTSPADLDALMRLWEREATLSQSALLLDCDGIDPADTARQQALTQIIEGLDSALILAGRQRQRPRQRLVVTFDVSKPTADEQRACWQTELGPFALRLDGQVDLLVSQFNLSAPRIRAVWVEALGHMAAQQSANPEGFTSNDQFFHLVWDTCRSQARPLLGDLAQHIQSSVTWHDLVLPELQLEVLRDIATHVRQRLTVYESWGFARKSERGLGISALFAGGSGTGKTLAAEVLAQALRLDLYRIDLSAVVSKYIGETEKNLARIFDAAEGGGVILLFDEADALFGKRGEVRDSHDRYANIEVSYLLQRMEAYRGLSILTTNMKSALDSAFTRRIRFIVQFPFPDADQRAQIWGRIFPPETPTQDLDWERLAQLNVAGGHIRNIALNAAFLAAEAGEPVRMEHLLRAARSEYVKLEKSLTRTEVKDWV
jgi:hypothetical protein